MMTGWVRRDRKAGWSRLWDGGPGIAWRRDAPIWRRYRLLRPERMDRKALKVYGAITFLLSILGVCVVAIGYFAGLAVEWLVKR